MNNIEKERIVKKYFNRIPAHIISLIFLCFSFKILMTTSYISKNWLNKLEILNKISLFNLMFLTYAIILILECLIDIIKQKSVIYTTLTIAILFILFYLFFGAINVDNMMTDILKEGFRLTRNKAIFRGIYAIVSLFCFVVFLTSSFSFLIMLGMKIKYILTFGKEE